MDGPARARDVGGRQEELEVGVCESRYLGVNGS